MAGHLAVVCLKGPWDLSAIIAVKAGSTPAAFTTHLPFKNGVHPALRMLDLAVIGI